ncbi:MAG: GyrI-like domain-containing protein [Paludisphaera borealis]|uniref:GyrI-like domain-containing protein n=1 Tax=Paludisphaera borealis TaxID=1387353 RepID=UPI00284C59CB|nr:GyrI-like domain-containing protein [Paludisphaera borealis]MDR3619279.1 GyrI-like domain-containing protein [Paludisphaera borealis]
MERALETAANFRDMRGMDGSMEYDIRLEQLGSRALAVVRRQASTRELPRVVPDACGTVWNVVRAQQVTGLGRHVAVYWDDQINLEVGVELAAPFVGHGEVVGSATPAGPVAATTHYGPYGQLHQAHEAIRRWCGSNGYTLAGPNWEIYGHWNDEWNSDPAKIRTDVFHLLVADGSSAAGPGAAADGGA